MTDEYKGHEKRGGALSRRKEDVFCTEHYLRWEHHDTDTNTHRTAVCAKIADLHKLVRETVPMKTFGIIITVSTIFLSGILGAMWHSIDKVSKENGDKLSVIHRRISENDKEYDKIKDTLHDVQWSLNAMSNRLSSVEQRIETIGKK
jgi:hypothetical protein